MPRTAKAFELTGADLMTLSAKFVGALAAKGYVRALRMVKGAA